MEITCSISAAKAAQFCEEARTTISLAKELPLLGTDTHRLLRAQSLGHCLNALASSAHFFHGPSVEHLRAYVIDWQVSDAMCKSGDGVHDFCAELNTLRNQVENELSQWCDECNYAPQPRGMVGSGAP